MTVCAVLAAAAAFAYAGFQATIRVLVYPQLAATPPAAFAALERSHQHRTSLVVGPLFALFGGTSVLALVVDTTGWTGATLACLLAILGVTAFAAVPAHRVLTEGPDPRVMSRLLRIDTVRLVLALVACATSLVAALTA